MSRIVRIAGHANGKCSVELFQDQRAELRDRSVGWPSRAYVQSEDVRRCGQIGRRDHNWIPGLVIDRMRTVTTCIERSVVRVGTNGRNGHLSNRSVGALSPRNTPRRRWQTLGSICIFNVSLWRWIVPALNQ